MSEILNELEQEINEDLRYDKLKKVWNKYGKVIIVSIALIVVGIIAYMSWMNYKKTAAIEETQKLVKVLNHIEQGKIQDAFILLKELSDKSSKDTKALAEIIHAGLRLKVYERPGEINEVQEQEIDELAIIAKDKSRDILWRDLATLTSALYEFGILSPQELINKIEPLTAENRPFRLSALEIMAHIYIKDNNLDKAKSVLEAIKETKDAPVGILRRAELMLQKLSSQ